MKLNILINGKPLNGYLNVDVLAQPNDQTKINADISNLDAVVDHNECAEVLAIGVLDFVPLPLRSKVLNNWLAKVSHGGTITLSGIDLNEFSRLVHNGQLNDVVQINQTLFGLCRTAWEIRKSYVPLDQTIQMIVQTGQFDIQAVKYDGIYYYVTARRK